MPLLVDTGLTRADAIGSLKLGADVSFWSRAVILTVSKSRQLCLRKEK